MSLHPPFLPVFLSFLLGYRREGIVSVSGAVCHSRWAERRRRGCVPLARCCLLHTSASHLALYKIVGWGMRLGLGG